jgi:1-acyl-sn-glycerol-3-phosphate acyltransferase
MIGRLRAYMMMGVWVLVLTLLGPFCILMTALTRREEFVTLAATAVIKAGLKAGGVKLTVEGRDRVDPKNGVYVYTPNHQSLIDAPIIWLALGTPRHRVGFLVKKELERVPIFGTGIGYIGMISVDRRNKERAIASARRATDRIHAGRSYAVYPEGTRTRTGELLPFKKGAFHMAIEAGVPIVPVTIDGAYRAMPPDGPLHLEPVPIRVVIHEPIPTEGMTHDDLPELLRRARAAVASALTS